MHTSAVAPVVPAPGQICRWRASRVACRRAAAAAAWLLFGPVWSVPVQLTEFRDRPTAAFDLSAQPNGAQQEPATTPLLDLALTSIEPGTAHLFDETLADERGSFIFEPASDQAFGRPVLSQRSLLLLSRVLLTQPPSASPAEPGNEPAPVELGSDLGRPAGPAGPQWSGGGLGGGLGGGSLPPSAGADAGDARSDAPAQVGPVFDKLLPAIDYLRENRYQILGMIAALLVLGAVGFRLIDRRIDQR